MSIRIFLADDHPIVRDGLRAVLATHADLKLIGETGDGLQVLPLVAQLQPDVLILDLMLPGQSGLEIAFELRQRASGTRIVILSAYADEAYVAEALRVGAAGYVLKKSAASELVAAIRAAAAGQVYISSQLSREALALHMLPTSTKPPIADALLTLTPRERQVFSLLAKGLTNGQVAAHLHIGQRTVETYRANIMHKLNLRTTADLVRLALQRGLILPE